MDNWFQKIGKLSEETGCPSELPPGNSAYVTYKRIRVDNRLVNEDRYIAIVIHAPKGSLFKFSIKFTSGQMLIAS